MTAAADAPLAWQSTIALESSERAHIAGILIDAHATDPVARRVLAEVNAGDHFDGDHGRASVGDRQADVDGGDEYETEGVNGRRIELPEGERRRRLTRGPRGLGCTPGCLLAVGECCGCWTWGRAHRLLLAREGPHLSLATSRPGVWLAAPGDAWSRGVSSARACERYRS
jgi:hypothetical protein